MIRVLSGLYRLSQSDRRMIWQALRLLLERESRPERLQKIKRLLTEIDQ